MTLNEYQKIVWSSYFGKEIGSREQLINNALGILGEAGEVADQVKKQLYLGRELSPYEIKEELGDLLWHLSCMTSVRGFTLDEIAEFNIEKLKKRYPEADWIDEHYKDAEWLEKGGED